MLQITNVTDELVSTFAFWSGLLALKFVIVSYLTGQRRLKTKSFTNPEDAQRHGSQEYCRQNEEVERLRRVARNDVENVLMFLFVAAAYMLTGPSPLIYTLLCGAYVLLRYAYSAAYMLAAPAPTRSMVYSIALYFVELPMILILLYSTLV